MLAMVSNKEIIYESSNNLDSLLLLILRLRKQLWSVYHCDIYKNAYNIYYIPVFIYEVWYKLIYT